MHHACGQLQIYSTVLYCLGLFLDEPGVPATKEGKTPPTLREVKYGGKSSNRVLCADRTVGNYLEQSPPFLVALWVGRGGRNTGEFFSFVEARTCESTVCLVSPPVFVRFRVMLLTYECEVPGTCILLPSVFSFRFFIPECTCRVKIHISQHRQFTSIHVCSSSSSSLLNRSHLQSHRIALQNKTSQASRRLISIPCLGCTPRLCLPHLPPPPAGRGSGVEPCTLGSTGFRSPVYFSALW